MHLLEFETFARTIAVLPAEAVLKALELESKMLEFGAENYRLYLSSDAYSIFCFRQFVRVIMLGEPMARCKPLPPEHLKFYRETLNRLIQANVLPQVAIEQFEKIFSAIQ